MIKSERNFKTKINDYAKITEREDRAQFIKSIIGYTADNKSIDDAFQIVESLFGDIS